jgi:ribosomal protein S15P/S13E
MISFKKALYHHIIMAEKKETKDEKETDIKTTKKSKEKTTSSEKSEKKQKLSEKDYEKKVLELEEQGLTSEKIGEALRKEKIHPKEHDKKISAILKASDSYTNPDLKNISENLEKVKTHYEKNKQDKRAKREIVRLQSHLRNLKIYYKEI